MTKNEESSLIGRYSSFPRGAQELSAASLAQSVVGCLEQAKAVWGQPNKDLAKLLGVSEGAVSQVLNGDGNIRISTLARYLRAMGFEARLSADPLAGGDSLPLSPRRVRNRRGDAEGRDRAPRAERMSVSVARCSVTDGDVVAPALSVLLVMADQELDVTRAVAREHQETPKKWHILKSDRRSWLATLTAEEPDVTGSHEQDSRERAVEVK